MYRKEKTFIGLRKSLRVACSLVVQGNTKPGDVRVRQCVVVSSCCEAQSSPKHLESSSSISGRVLYAYTSSTLYYLHMTPFGMCVRSCIHEKPAVRDRAVRVSKLLGLDPSQVVANAAAAAAASATSASGTTPINDNNGYTHAPDGDTASPPTAAAPSGPAVDLLGGGFDFVEGGGDSGGGGGDADDIFGIHGHNDKDTDHDGREDVGASSTAAVSADDMLGIGSADTPSDVPRSGGGFDGLADSSLSTGISVSRGGAQGPGVSDFLGFDVDSSGGPGGDVLEFGSAGAGSTAPSTSALRPDNSSSGGLVLDQDEKATTSLFGDLSVKDTDQPEAFTASASSGAPAGPGELKGGVASGVGVGGQGGGDAGPASSSGFSFMAGTGDVEDEPPAKPASRGMTQQ